MNAPVLHRAIPILRVASADASIPFYEALGFEVEWQHQLTPDAPRLTCVQQSSVELFLTEHDVAPVGTAVLIVVGSVDEFVARAHARSVGPTFGPEDRPWGDREAYYTDPDSNVLRLQQLRASDEGSNSEQA